MWQFKNIYHQNSRYASKVKPNYPHQPPLCSAAARPNKPWLLSAKWRHQSNNLPQYRLEGCRLRAYNLGIRSTSSKKFMILIDFQVLQGVYFILWLCQIWSIDIHNLKAYSLWLILIPIYTIISFLQNNALQVHTNQRVPRGHTFRSTPQGPRPRHPILYPIHRIALPHQQSTLCSFLLS